TLTVAMKPYFSFQKFSGTYSFHPQSPAGRLSHLPLDGHLFDPHQNKGGMGLSTAEFIFQYSEKNKKTDKWAKDSEQVIQCWQTYRQLHADEKNPPSGVDLITQLMGGYLMTHLKNEMWMRKELAWPFADWDWALIKTGIKLPTHEHLKKDLNHLNFKRAGEICSDIIKGFYQKESLLFLQSMKSWSQWLEDENLLASHSKRIITELESLPGFLLAKGCGAMGSDQVFILFEESKKEEFQIALKQKKFDSSQIQYSEQQDNQGLHFENS
ncbi:MAG: hypothetical protein ACK5W9_11030, partial [Bdellovibrionales bacterium]